MKMFTEKSNVMEKEIAAKLEYKRAKLDFDNEDKLIQMKFEMLELQNLEHELNKIENTEEASRAGPTHENSKKVDADLKTILEAKLSFLYFN